MPAQMKDLHMHNYSSSTWIFLTESPTKKFGKNHTFKHLIRNPD